MHRFVVGRLSDGSLSEHTVRQMFELRHRVFHERLRWDVRSFDGQERDEFDDASTVYVIAKSYGTGQVEACWRLRPTTAHYMLNTTFPELLHGKSAPRDPSIWEVSRFAVVHAGDDGSAFGFSQLTQSLVAKTVEFGLANKISEFVWVCSTAVERLAKNLGYEPERLGAPRQIGKVRSVASRIFVNERTIAVATNHLYPETNRVAA